MELLGGFPPTGINFDSATQLAKTKNHPAGWFPFWSCYPDSNWRPHPYQVIKCHPAVAVQGFAAIFAPKRMRSETLCSMCSVRSFPRVGHGVGQHRRQRRCGSTFSGRGMVTFCAAGNNKRVSKRRHRATGRSAMLPPGGSAGFRYASRMGQNVGQSVFSASRNGGRTS